MTTLDLSDIQGNILRGYRAPHVRYFGIVFGTAEGARKIIGTMVTGDENQAPQVTNASTWECTPKYCLNLGVTAAGLKALGLPEAWMKLFPTAFLRGPAAKAAALGDSGTSAPENWTLGNPANPEVHALVSLYTYEGADRQTARLQSLFTLNNAQCVYQQDGTAMPGDRVHFNFRDGISQPRITGSPGIDHPDMQPPADPGEFLMGKNYVNQFGGNFAGDLPSELVDNGTYGAFRILKQDVFEFEDFVATAGRKYAMDPELVAAKMMGRWRGGAPLTLAPSQDREIPEEDINKFDYGPSTERPEYYDDAEGFRCPVSSHIRRMNPRNALVMGKPHTRRIIRRNYPYGPAIQPGDAPDDIERGLIGFFICGDLEMQFEFLQKIWANMDIATTGLRGSRDPIIGAHPDHGGQFVIRTQDRRDPIIFDSIPRMVHTRGSVYCFIPSLSGLRFLANQTADSTAKQGA